MSRHRRQRNRRYQRALHTPQMLADLARADRYFDRTGQLIPRCLVCPLARCLIDRKIDAMMERWMDSKFRRFNLFPYQREVIEQAGSKRFHTWVFK